MPDALRVTRLKPSRKFTVLGELSSEVGWKHKELIARLESKRKVRSEAYYQRKKEGAKMLTQAKKEVDLSAVMPVLAQYGF